MRRLAGVPDAIYSRQKDIVSMTNQEMLRKAFAEGLEIEPSQVTDELAYDSIREWDSIAHMNLVAQLEEVFGVMLDTDDIIAMSSVAKAKEILTKYGVSI